MIIAMMMMTCNFTFSLTIFQSYHDDERMKMNDFICNVIPLRLDDFCCHWVSNPALQEYRRIMVIITYCYYCSLSAVDHSREATSSTPKKDVLWRPETACISFQPIFTYGSDQNGNRRGK